MDLSLRRCSKRSWANVDGIGGPVGSKCTCFRTDGDVASIDHHQTLKHSQAQECNLTSAKQCAGIDKYCGNQL